LLALGQLLIRYCTGNDNMKLNTKIIIIVSMLAILYATISIAKMNMTLGMSTGSGIQKVSIYANLSIDGTDLQIDGANLATEQ
jgi:hypothetical protein